MLWKVLGTLTVDLKGLAAHLVPEPVRGPIEIADAPESLEVKPMSRPENRPPFAGAADVTADEAGWAAGEAADGVALAAALEAGLDGPAPTFIPLNISPPASTPAAPGGNIISSPQSNAMPGSNWYRYLISIFLMGTIAYPTLETQQGRQREHRAAFSPHIHSLLSAPAVVPIIVKVCRVSFSSPPSMGKAITSCHGAVLCCH